MPFYNVGDTNKALCSECKAIVPTIFQLKELLISG